MHACFSVDGSILFCCGQQDSDVLMFLHVRLLWIGCFTTLVFCFCVHQLLEPCVLEVVEVILFSLYELLPSVFLLVC